MTSYQVVESVETYEYDDYYDTRADSRYSDSSIGIIAGIVLIICGIALAVFSIVDLDLGVYNQSKLASTSMIWTENPIWPTYGKGIWVGLLLIGAGILGIFAHCENTLTAIKAFGVICLIMAVLTFYLIITTIKEIQYAAELNKLQSLTYGQYNTYTMNSAMAAFGSLAFLVTLVAGLLSIGFTDCFQDARFEPTK